MPLQVELVSPERVLYSGEAREVICRTIDGGEVAFLTGHAPFLGALEISPVTIKPAEGADVVAAVHGGFVHVKADKVTLLSDVAELSDQIDVERARRAQEAAEQEARTTGNAGREAALRRAHVRLDVARRK